jgi:hypothetical protein
VSIDDESSDWPAYRRLINYRLDHIDTTLDSIEKRLYTIDTHLTGLMAKASLVGGATGLVVAAVFSALVRKFIG